MIDHTRTGSVENKMALPNITATRVMYIAAVQIGLTTIGFILYKRPHLWGWTALQYYKEVYCGTNLDTINSKFISYSEQYQSQVIHHVKKYRRQCNEEYLQ